MFKSGALKWGDRLVLAVNGDSEADVKALLFESGCDVNAVQLDKKQTSLYLAASKGSKNMVDALLGHQGIDVNQADGDGVTPLNQAAT